MAFQPCIDGEHIPEMPIDSITAGMAKGKPVLIGTTLEENKLFTSMDPANANLDMDGVRKQLGAVLNDDDVDQLLSTYTDALGRRGDDPTPLALATAINTDRGFRMPAIRLAEAQANHADDVYVYQFNWKTDAMGGILGACHALEIAYVFATHRTPGLDQFAGANQPGADELAETMQAHWVAFAQTGNPGEGVAPYSQNRSTLVYDTRSVVDEDPNSEERQVWDKLGHAIGTM